MAETKAKIGVFAKIKHFFKDFKSEVKKITWPSRKQVIHNTSIVLVAIVLVGLVIWGLDFVFGTGMDLILRKGL